jgi:serine/threonine protein kinase
VLELRFTAVAEENNQMVNGYSIIDKLGSGRFGKVLRVSGPDGCHFALKVCERQKLAKIFGIGFPAPSGGADALPLQTILRTSEYDALCNEVRLLRAVCHPNIVRVFDAFESSAKTYVLMELLSCPLLEVSPSASLFTCPVSHVVMGEGQAKEYARHIITAVSFLHAKGTSHGDIKPENVMLRCVDGAARYEAVLVDLGKASQHFSIAAGPIGTPAFSSPESFDGPFDTFLCDMWAIGVTVFCMVFGRLPFTVPHGRRLLGDDEAPQMRSLVASIQSMQWCMSDAECAGSDELFSFLDSLLCPSGSRLEAAAALKHVWVQA